MSLLVLDGAVLLLTTAPDCGLMGSVRMVEIKVRLINEWVLIMSVIKERGMQSKVATMGG